MNTGRIKQGYGTVQRDVMTSSEISVFAKALYCLLVSYAGEKNSCFPSLKVMCDNLNISKPTVIKSLKELIAAKLLIAHKSRTKMGDFANNVYYPMYIMDSEVVNDIDKEVVKEVDTGGQLQIPGVVNEVDSKNNIKKINNKNKETGLKSSKSVFVIPTIDEVKTYFKEKECSDLTQPEGFHDFYTSKGWKVGREPMKDWKAAVRNWLRSNNKTEATQAPNQKISL